ncbi:MAG TPA: class I SAM-dependent methyltransferase [Burkholderiales bacterium]
MPRTALSCLYSVLLAACVAAPPHQDKAYEPIPGQPGKDVVWFPSPPATVEAMLDLARVGPSDYAVDLGSGDGRNVIAAAKRGARALGVEYNPELVELSRRNARAAGVADRAQFVEGDMFAADFSQASVLALFLIPENLRKLKEKFARMKPGTRIVSNAFEIPGWQPAQTATAHGDCTAWCTAYLYIVPAWVEGRWRLGDAQLTFEQDFENLSGSLQDLGLVNARVSGERIRFLAGLDEYVGRVHGDAMSGTVSGSRSGPWSAVRIK